MKSLFEKYIVDCGANGFGLLLCLSSWCPCACTSLSRDANCVNSLHICTNPHTDLLLAESVHWARASIHYMFVLSYVFDCTRSKSLNWLSMAISLRTTLYFSTTFFRYFGQKLLLAKISQLQHIPGHCTSRPVCHYVINGIVIENAVKL
jgi:hypothetical protein